MTPTLLFLFQFGRTKLQTQDIKYMEVDFDAQKEYNIQQEAVMQDLVFSGDCSSWYKGGSATGKPDAIFSGSCECF